MWTCPKCGRIFRHTGQLHSCKKIPLQDHFRGKDQAKLLFEVLYKHLISKVGPCQIISLPCCIHLFGTYDFLAALPKKDHLEIRFALDHILNSPRLKQSVPLSSKHYKNCLDLINIGDIDSELLRWINLSYHLIDANPL